MVIKDTDAAWMAGYLDGEGYFVIRFHKQGRRWEVGVSVASNVEASLLRCASITQGGTISKWLKNNQPNAKLFRVWRSSDKHLDAWLAHVAPFLSVKQEQANICLASRAQVAKRSSGRYAPTSKETHAKRMAMRLALMALTHRGIKPISAEKIEALTLVRQMLSIGPYESPPVFAVFDGQNDLFERGGE